MKKELLDNLKIEFDRRKVIEQYLKIVLDTATDFYGVLYVDDVNKTFKVKEIYNIRLDNKKIENIIEGLEYTGNEGEIVPNPKGYNIKSKLCRVKLDGDDERIIEFRWHAIGNGQVIITGKDKTLEKQLIDYNKDLKECIEVENMKSQFFSNLSHEFKTPINLINSASQLIKMKGTNNQILYDKEYFNKYLSIVKQNSYRLSRLINNLIDTRRIDDGYYKLHLGNYNIVKIIKDVADSMKDYLDSKERKFIFESECDELILSCDPEKIERIIMNLISNAVKYTNKSNIIKIEIKRQNKEAVITVSNNGVKLDQESAKIIFNRFVRADNVLSRRCEGSGIGLYIVKSLVELHGGKIWVDVKEKDITKFIFSIPIAKVEDKLNNIDNKKICSKSERCNIEFSDIY